MDLYSYLWLAGIILLTVTIVLYSVPKLIELARMKKLFDDDSNERKIHDGSVPNIGGAGLILAFLVSYSLHPSSVMLAGYESLVAATVIIMAIGLKDDLLVISAKKKFLGEILIATIMIFGAGVLIENFGGVFGLYELPAAFAIFMSYAVIIVMINAMNLIDGIDGLAASVTAVASLLFGVWFFMIGHYSLFVFSVILAVSYGTFLVYNWSPAKVFMGDTGSLFAGFSLSFLAIHFLNTGIYTDPIVSWQSAIPVLLVAILVIPLYDTLRVFILRVWSRKSPFKADDNHVHHHFLRHGFSHAQSTISLIVINLVIVAATLVLSHYLTINWLLFTVVGFALLSLPTVYVKRRVLQTVNLDTIAGFNLNDMNGEGISQGVTAVPPDDAAGLRTLEADTEPGLTDKEKVLEEKGM